MASRKGCARCGADKPPGRGRRFCEPCDALKGAALNERRRIARGIRTDKKVPRRSAPQGKKWCPSCEQYLMLGQFKPNKSKANGLSSYCKACHPEIMHATRMKRVFGITAEEYQSILEHQGGGCAICGTVPRRKRLAVDHDHKSGNVRGLLCTMCNHKVLGGAKDDVEILRRAVGYLDSPPAFDVIGERAIPSGTGCD